MSAEGAKVSSHPSSHVASGDGVVFVAMAEQYVKATEEGKKPQLRRVAVVGLPSGELTWAELMGREEGCIHLCEPAARATAEELAALKALSESGVLEEAAYSRHQQALLADWTPNCW